MYKGLEKTLSNQKYIAGDNLTIADFNVACELNQLPFLNQFLPADLRVTPETFPNVARYMKDMAAVPGHDDFLKAAQVIEDLVATIQR
jgi:glutathione S-transferase